MRNEYYGVTFIVVIFIAITATARGVKNVKLNDRPIIGILAQRLKSILPVNGTSYISAAYVKYLESAGARVVPISTNVTEAELNTFLGKINGVLFPGGNVDFADSSYERNAKIVFNFAIRENDEEKHFPLWGTCLGFQQLLVLVGGINVISSSAGTEDLSLSLNLTPEVLDSRIFLNIPDNVRESLTTQSLTYNAHRNCVSVDTYNDNPVLQKFFKVLSTNNDLSGKTFLSTIEGRHYPFYGIQWHAEMVPYEFTINEGLGKNINHSHDAVRMAQYFANFFVNEARRSLNNFASKDEEVASLIYNYPPFHSATYGWFDEQVYIF